jgi:hypothetical protein
MNYPNVNAHLHTPYSFSAFESLTEALDRAKAENVKVVGINDFYSMDGYVEWRDQSISRGLYPLFNIEFISLQEDDQQAGIRVNDPNNPGRTYLSGKGLKCPPSLPEPFASQLQAVRAESNVQVAQMCARLNETLAINSVKTCLDFDEIKQKLTKGSVRERHLAKALRLAVYNFADGKPELIASILEKLFGGKPLKSEVANHAAVENEIRGNLLKAGGAAFVPESPAAFLPMEAVRKIILAAGGIPTYPFLADDAKGNFTDFEQNVARTVEILKARGIFSAEFITTRNSAATLELYAGYLVDNGFVVTFGSEHNTPAMEPIELFTREGAALTDRLKQINYEGACITAAHQALTAEGKTGYLDADGRPDTSRRKELAALGDRLIRNIE